MTMAVVWPTATVGVQLPVHHRLPMDQPEDGYSLLRLVAGLLQKVILAAVRRHSA